jgi:hypothetical protein
MTRPLPTAPRASKRHLSYRKEEFTMKLSARDLLKGKMAPCPDGDRLLVA